MVYLPRHFLANNHLAVEAALGRDATAPSSRATATSAVNGARRRCAAKGLDPRRPSAITSRPVAARLGLFSIDDLDIAGGHGSISLRNSIFALEAGQRRGSALHYVRRLRHRGLRLPAWPSDAR